MPQHKPDELTLEGLKLLWAVLDRIGKSHEYMGEWELCAHTYMISSELTKAWNREKVRIHIGEPGQ